MAIELAGPEPGEGFRRLIGGTRTSLVSEGSGDYSSSIFLPDSMDIPTAFGIALGYDLPPGLAFWAGTMTAQYRTNLDIVQMTGTYWPRGDSARKDFPSTGTRVIKECQRGAQGMRPDKTCPIPTITHEMRLYGRSGSPESRYSDFTVSGLSENGSAILELYSPQNALSASRVIHLDSWWKEVRQMIAQSQLRVINHAS